MQKKTCEKIHEVLGFEERVCEWGLCLGDGIRDVGDADDIIETECLCAKEQIV